MSRWGEPWGPPPNLSLPPPLSGLGDQGRAAPPRLELQPSRGSLGEGGGRRGGERPQPGVIVNCPRGPQLE